MARLRRFREQCLQRKKNEPFEVHMLLLPQVLSVRH